MKNLLEIAKLLLTIDTRHFEQESIEEIDISTFNSYTVLYDKNGVKIILATEWDGCGNNEDEYYDECEYLFASGLTQEEKTRIENGTDMIYKNRITYN